MCYNLYMKIKFALATLFVLAVSTNAYASVAQYNNKLNVTWDASSMSSNSLLTLSVWYGCGLVSCKSNEQKVVREVFAKDGSASILLNPPTFHEGDDVWFNLYDKSFNLLATSPHFKISSVMPTFGFISSLFLDGFKSSSSTTKATSTTNVFPLKARCTVRSTDASAQHWSFTSGSEGGVAPYKYTWTLGSSEFDNLSTVSVDEAHQVGIKVVDGMGSMATSTCSDITPSTFTQNTESCLNLNTFLGLGSRGNDVTLLQKFLINQGFLKTEASGYFGQATYGALKAFQSANAIDLTGSAGPITRSRINKLSCTH